MYYITRLDMGLNPRLA